MNGDYDLISGNLILVDDKLVHRLDVLSLRDWSLSLDDERFITLERKSKKAPPKPSKNQLIGRWKNGDSEAVLNMEVSFSKSEYTVYTMGIEISIPYKVEESKIVFSQSGVKERIDFKVNGDTLILNGEKFIRVSTKP
jgi:hypothetical protein